MGPGFRRDDERVTELRWSRTASRCELLLLGLRGLLQGQLIAQFVTRELADRGPRQVVDEIERCGNFVLAELAGEESFEFFQRERNPAVAKFDKCLGRLAAV